jgi:hypothetical protein
MAARNKAWTPTKVRERIRVSMLMRRLNNHVLGNIEMSQSQVVAATYLISQAIGKPAQAVEHSGSIAHTYDTMLLGLLNGRTVEAGDAPSAQPVTH